MDKRVNIRIFDKDINFLGEVDSYTSLFYIRKWNTYNECEFHATNYNKELFKKNNIMMLNNDTSKVAVIKHVEVENSDTKDVLIKAYGLTRWFLDRITYPPVDKSYDYYNDNIENIMLGLVNVNAINPTDANRKIPYLVADTTQNRGDKTIFQSRYGNLLDELTKLSEMSQLGFKIDLDYKNKQFIFKVVNGLDRSTEQNINSYAIFARKFDNILSEKYTDSDIDYKNCAIIGGQGEGIDRQIEYINNDLVGIDRKELFIDARDLENQEDTTNLIDRGKEKLAEYQEVKSHECVINSKDYKKSWDLGDFITIRNDEVGITQKAQIKEVKEIYEQSSSVEVTFGNTVTSFSDKLKQLSNRNFENKEISIGINQPLDSYNGKIWIKTIEEEL